MWREGVQYNECTPARKASCWWSLFPLPIFSCMSPGTQYHIRGKKRKRHQPIAFHLVNQKGMEPEWLWQVQQLPTLLQLHSLCTLHQNGVAKVFGVEGNKIIYFPCFCHCPFVHLHESTFQKSVLKFSLLFSRAGSCNKALTYTRSHHRRIKLNHTYT